MKLSNVCEQKQNYLTDPQEIDSYVRNVLRYKLDYDILPDNVVLFKNDLTFKNFPNNKLDIKFSCEKTVSYFENNFSTFEDFPVKCKTLWLARNSFEKVEIPSNVTGDIYVSDNFKLEDVILHDCNNLLNIYDSQITNNKRLNIKKIEYKGNETVKSIKCYGSDKLISFKQIIVPSKKITKLIITACAIRSFKHFDFHIENSCHFLLPDLDNYQYVDNIKCDGKIKFNVYSNINNIITFLLNSCNLLQIDFYIKEVSDIMQQYLHMEPYTRAEHVMDCAVELIDAGFEEAAEL